MLKERRDWVHDYKAHHANKPPDDLTKFYERFNVETPFLPRKRRPRNCRMKRMPRVRRRRSPKKKKEGKKKKKKGDKDEDESKQIIKFQPSEVVQKIR